MNIEAGKYYRMRCGGAVRIDKIEHEIAYGEDEEMTWILNGKFTYVTLPHPFDLIAEITEVEYNRIISGEPSGNSEQLEALKADGFKALFEDEARKNEALRKEGQNLLKQQADLYVKIEDLQSENTRLQAQIDRLTGDDAFDRILKRSDREQRRFEAAKAAMQGILAGGWRVYDLDTKIFAVKHADALLEALEETK